MSPLSPTTINIELVRNAYERAASTSKKSPLSFDEVLAQPVDEHWARMLAGYSSRLLVTREESPQGHLFINGKYHAFGGVSYLLPMCEKLADGTALDSICTV